MCRMFVGFFFPFFFFELLSHMLSCNCLSGGNRDVGFGRYLCIHNGVQAMGLVFFSLGGFALSVAVHIYI